MDFLVETVLANEVSVVVGVIAALFFGFALRLLVERAGAVVERRRAARPGRR
jgi:hypothetical protein